MCNVDATAAGEGCGAAGDVPHAGAVVSDDDAAATGGLANDDAVVAKGECAGMPVWLAMSMEEAKLSVPPLTFNVPVPLVPTKTVDGTVSEPPWRL